MSKVTNYKVVCVGSTFMIPTMKANLRRGSMIVLPENVWGEEDVQEAIKVGVLRLVGKSESKVLSKPPKRLPKPVGPPPVVDTHPVREIVREEVEQALKNYLDTIDSLVKERIAEALANTPPLPQQTTRRKKESRDG